MPSPPHKTRCASRRRRSNAAIPHAAPPLTPRRPSRRAAPHAAPRLMPPPRRAQVSAAIVTLMPDSSSVKSTWQDSREVASR